MKRVSRVVLQETLYIGVWSLILSALMQAIFLIIGWEYQMLLGNILGAVAGVLNFFLLGITVQRATSSGDVKYAKNLMKTSQAGRMFMLVVIGIIGAVIPSVFNIWATLIPLFFPRIALLVRPAFFTKAQREASKQEKASPDEQETASNEQEKGADASEE